MARVYEALSRQLYTANCYNAGASAHLEEKAQRIIDDHIPHGSGIDLEWRALENVYVNEAGNRLYLESEFHRMNENGMYDGWIKFKVVIKPSLLYGHDLTVYCSDAQIREYLEDIFLTALDKNIIVKVEGADNEIDGYAPERSMAE